LKKKMLTRLLRQRLASAAALVLRRAKIPLRCCLYVRRVLILRCYLRAVQKERQGSWQWSSKWIRRASAAAPLPKHAKQFVPKKSRSQISQGSKRNISAQQLKPTNNFP